MAGSRLSGTPTKRPLARPLPGATWQDHVLDATAVQRALDRLWAGISETAAAAGASLDRAASSTSDNESASVEVRASTFNLIAVARRQADAARIEDAVLRLGDLNPSRATILVADPGVDRPAEAGLGVRVALVEQPGGKDRQPIRFESVTVEASAQDDRHLASVASPLLVADLPDFLWWPGDGFVGSKLFEDLMDVSDRVMIDSAELAEPTKGLHFLAGMLSRAQGCPNMSDFAWARLASWRQIVAQFFDPPTALPLLDAIDEVTIYYADCAGGTSGFSAGLLMAGWLATRLGWTAPGEMVPMGDPAEGWRVTLRAGSRGQLREVVLWLQPTADPNATRSLGGVVLRAGGATPSTFRIERVDALGLSTRSEIRGRPPVSRMVYATTPDDPTLLADELRVFGRDVTFEEALAFAATLAPEGADREAA